MTARLRPIPVTPPLPTGVVPGAVVAYRGRIASEHWSTFYISTVDEVTHLLTLVDLDYPDVTTLRNVHPRSVQPTGATIVLCGCGHQAGSRHYEQAQRCGWDVSPCAVRTCGCTLHDQPRDE